MKKTIIFTVLITLLASLAIVAVAAEERPDGKLGYILERESKNFSDDETFYSRMANYCARMMSGGYYERPSRDGYGGGYGSCH
ncbi:hypothetical protein AGMMS50276_22830 [Synergistales bacterium]|nr:hypothetical protein AGMMS50276_22830 [Synergistales bacterium]